MATFTEEQAKVIRDYATNLSADERGNFINRFKSLTDDGQIELANRITKAQTGPKLPQGITPELLASKGLPQILKSAYELPFAKKIVNALPGGQQLKDIIAATPEPTTLGAKMARFVSKEALPISASLPYGLFGGGAVYGGIKAAQENKNIPLEAAKMGAISYAGGKALGAVGSAVKGIATKVPKYADMAIKSFTKPGAIRNELASLEKNIGVPVESGGRPLSVRATEAIAQQKRNFEAGLINERANLNTNIKSLDDKIFSSANDAVSVAKKELPGFFKGNSTVYGNKLDEIANILTKEGRSLTYGQTDEILTKTLDDLDALNLSDGPIYDSLKSLKDKYSVKFLVGQGARASRLPRSNEADLVNFGKFYNDLRSAKSMISSQVKSGGRFTKDDIAYSLLNNNVGEKIPELASLQKDYSPVINAMKEATKKFKPFNGDFNDRAGVNFLKKVAYSGKQGLTKGEIALLDAIEKGNTKFAPGIDTITETLKNLGIERRNLKSLIEASGQKKIDFLAKINKAKDVLPSIKEKEAELKTLKEIRMGILKAAGAVAGAGAIGTHAINITQK